MSPEWNQQEERGTPLMLHTILWIALRLGRTTARVILYPITLYFLLFAPVARRSSYEFLRRATGHDVHWWQIAKHIHHFSAITLDRVFLLTGKYSGLDIRIHNLEALQKLLQRKLGCILIGSHIGSFEVLRTVGVFRDRVPIKILMHEAHNAMITRLLHSLNPDIGDTVIQSSNTDAMLQAHEFLKQGYVIGMLGDRVVDMRKTAHCDVLGYKAPLPVGPFMAAAVMQAPVMLFFGIYQGGNRYDIFFEKFADRITVKRTQRDRDIHHWVQKFADRLSHYARMHPYNWFNFYDFWEHQS
jgi:predicted LPLAT superfamily acyltransferase